MVEYGDVVDFKCSKCKGKIEYMYETTGGNHTLFCPREMLYITITKEQFDKLKVLEPFREQE